MKRRMLRIAALMLAMSMVLGACGNQDAPATGTELLENTEHVRSEKEEEGSSELPTETEEQAEGTEKPEGTEELESAEDAKNPEETQTEESEPTEVVTESETEAEQAPAYTVTALEAKTMYAKQSVNVRKGPSSDYEKVGSLKTNDEVTVIGQANETGWYQIQYNGIEAFVSNNYLSDTKIKTQVSTGTADGVVDTPTSENIQAPEATPSTNNTSTSGGHISWSGPGTTLPNIGVSIPTLGSFNKEALNDNIDGFAGDLSTPEGLAAGQTIYDTADSIESTVKNLGIPCDTGFVVQNNAIEWEFTTYGSMNAFELHRRFINGVETYEYYSLEVNMRLADGHHVLAGTDLAPYARDILLYLCSVISSQPNTLSNYIYEVLEVDGSKISTSSWTSVGDCKIKIDPNFYDNHYVFYITQGE